MIFLCIAAILKFDEELLDFHALVDNFVALDLLLENRQSYAGKDGVNLYMTCLLLNSEDIIDGIEEHLGKGLLGLNQLTTTCQLMHGKLQITFYSR